MVGGGGRVQPVERFGHDAHRSVKANAVVRAHQVVVQGLGHADDRRAALGQPIRDPLGAVAADGDEGVEVSAMRVEDPFTAALGVVEVVAGRAEQGAALSNDAAQFFGGGRPSRVIAREPGPAVSDPIISCPSRKAIMPSPRIAAFRPGASPPAVRTPMRIKACLERERSPMGPLGQIRDKLLIHHDHRRPEEAEHP